MTPDDIATYRTNYDREAWERITQGWRLTDAHFAKLKAIGMDRLRAWIDKAKVKAK